MRFYETSSSNLDGVTRYEASTKAHRVPENTPNFTGRERDIDVTKFIKMYPFEDGVLKPSELVDSGYWDDGMLYMVPYDERIVVAYLLRMGYTGILTYEVAPDGTMSDVIQSAYPFPAEWVDAPNDTADKMVKNVTIEQANIYNKAA